MPTQWPNWAAVTRVVAPVVDGLVLFKERMDASLAAGRARAEEARLRQRHELETREREHGRQKLAARVQRAEKLAAAIDDARRELPARLDECDALEGHARELSRRGAEAAARAAAAHDASVRLCDSLEASLGPKLRECDSLEAARAARQIAQDVQGLYSECTVEADEDGWRRLGELASLHDLLALSPLNDCKAQLASCAASVEALTAELAKAHADAAAACARARALADAVTASYWAPEDDDAWHAARVKRPEEASQIATLVSRCASLKVPLDKAGAVLAAAAATVEEEAAALTKLRAMLDAIEPPRPLSPSPPGSRAYTLPPLAAAEEAIVNDALGHGPSGEMLADYKNIPITRKDMATLAPHEWLNDEVINYFFKLLETREAEAVEAARAGCTDNVTLAWPRCHFHQTNFYTKLIGGGGYTYKSVSRWTKKVDVFSKDLIIVPIHVHGNHWTLAVINFKERRFEYYDSLRGSAESILTNLRRWLEDESLDKKKVPYDTSEWTEVVWKAKTPTQRNGFDCGVFMTRTADWLARDAVLSFTQEDMEHFRRIHVLEIMQEALMPP